MTSKRLIEYAKRHGYPYLCVHAGKKTESSTDESVKYLSLKRSPLSFPMDEDLKYDPFFQRHANRVLQELMKFQPDVIHITGLNDVSIIGAYLSWKLQIPMVGSWHTNLHEFAARRLTRMLRFLPAKTLDSMTHFAERKIMDGAVLYYKMPKVVLSPNQELVNILAKGTKRASRLMSRGVDTDKFSPAKRTVNDNVFRFGFVGRLRAEKNVRLLANLEKKLIEKGMLSQCRLVVGCHSQLTSILNAVHAGVVSVVMFNLGYLPLGDKSIVTRPATTLAALDQASELVRPGGLISVLAYPGHAGGLDEANCVANWVGRCEIRFHTEKYRDLSNVNSPILWAFAKVS